MKRYINKVFPIVASVFLVASCSKKIDDVYQNPNADARVPVESLLPHLINCMAGNYGGHGPLHDVRYVGAYIQSFAWNSTQSNFDRMGYTQSTADVAQSTWRMHYYDIGQNNNRMIQWAADEKKWDYVGVGNAIWGWSWLTLADYYGETIVKDAFNTSLATFLYDSQEMAYDRAKHHCFAALENLNKTGGNMSQANLALGDKYFYNGDVNKWKKFVYGVLARYHNHFSNKSTYNADSVIYYANLAMLDNADNAVVRFPATALATTNSYFGPIRTNLTTNTAVNPAAVRQGAYIANLMNGTNPEFGVEDPRAWYMLRGNANGTIKGVEPSAGQTVIAANDRPENFWGTSQVTGVVNTAPATQNGTYLFRNESPVPVLTASEMYFLMAEAHWRKGEKETALIAYREGISKNFDMLTTVYNVNILPGKEITPAVKASFMGNTAVVPATGAGLNLSKIMLQKYIALYVHGALETWLDMRRFHYTDADPATGNQVYRSFTLPADLFPDNGGKVVQRMRPRYNSEYLWNVVELERIGATKNDYHVKELWITQP